MQILNCFKIIIYSSRMIKKDLIKWGKLLLSLLGIFSVIQINVVSKMLFLFQILPILTMRLHLSNGKRTSLNLFGKKKIKRYKLCRMPKKEMV